MSDLHHQTSQNLYSQFPPETHIRFCDGLPGFPDEHEFVFIQNQEERPLAWLQSLKTPDLAFLVTSPFSLFPDYRPDVNDQDLKRIQASSSEVLVLCIIKFQEAPPELHTNLKAPIVINLKTFDALQTILANESMYSERAVYKIK